MKKHAETFIRITLLAVSLAMFASICGCAAGNNDGDGTISSDGTTAPGPVVLSSGGKSTYSIVHRSSCTDDTLASFRRVVRYLNTELGSGMAVADDWLMPGTDAASLNEILIGSADRDECREVYEDTPPDGYLIRRVGNKIVIAAHNDKRLDEAVSAFMSMTKKDNENGDVVLDAFTEVRDGSAVALFGKNNPLAEQRIVYRDGCSDKAAKLLASKIKSAYGVELPIVTDSEAPTDKEIVIGMTDRSLPGDTTGMKGAYAKIGYRLFVRNGKLFILGGDDSDDVNYEAVTRFCEKYITPKLSPVLAVTPELSEDGLGGMDVPAELADGANARIMSFNILSEEWDSAAVMKGRDYPVAATILNYSPDVAGIQEVSATWYSRLQSLIGSEYEFVGKTIPSGNYNYTALAYNKNKVRLIDSGMTVYSVGNSPRLRLLNWGVFESKASGSRFIVCNTHYDANHTGDHTPIRVKQATEMAEIVNGLVEKYKVPVFCCGDYNCTEESEPFGTFMKLTGFKDPKFTAAKIDNPIKTYHKLGEAVSRENNLGIDHIACSPDAEVLYYNTLCGKFWLPISDHFPIYIDVNLK